MLLRTKILTLLVVLFAAYAVLAYSIQYRVIYPSFHELEREEATKNVERALGAFQREVELLGFSAMDWARWDDTYRFVADRNSAYREANLNATALESLNVNLLSLYDLAGEKIWGLGYDPATEQELDLGELSLATLPPGHPLLADAGDTELVSGLVLTSQGPTLVVSHPILDSNGRGPARGTIVMGRLLDEKAMARLAAQARVKLIVKQLKSGEAAADEPIKKSGSLPHTAVALEEMPAITIGAATIFDLRGQPVLRLLVDNPREITARGRKALAFATWSLAGAGGLVLTVMLLLLGRTVLKPVSRLTRHAMAVGASDDLGSRLRMERSDEVGILAREFDRMVERLAETRQRLLDQSYKCGVAEAAVGVLHNIGNAVTPVGVKLTMLQNELQQAPAAEMQLAGAELADPATPAARRTDMLRFMELAGPELANLVSHAARELEAVRAQVDHVQLILADQQRFSRAERILEPVDLAPLVQESVGLLTEHLQHAMKVEVDAGLAAIGKVRASRVALQQVLVNLLINAGEAILEGGQGPETGRVRILADREEVEGRPMVHLRLQDNGIGIPAESLPRLFESGFSSKGRGSGMGLHWSANTMMALQGRIRAESAGTGQGATLHLYLPLARSSAELENAA